MLELSFIFKFSRHKMSSDLAALLCTVHLTYQPFLFSKQLFYTKRLINLKRMLLSFIFSNFGCSQCLHLHKKRPKARLLQIYGPSLKIYGNPFPLLKTKTKAKIRQISKAIYQQTRPFCAKVTTILDSRHPNTLDSIIILQKFIQKWLTLP